MAAYILVLADVWDGGQYAEYIKVTPGIIARHGGRFVVRGGAPEVLEGAEEGRRIVLLEFPTREAARGFYESAEYQEARKLRAGAAEATFILLDGYVPAA